MEAGVTGVKGVCVCGSGWGPFTVSDEGEVAEINAEQWHEVM